MTLVGYIRVSTDRQGEHGLGMQAQRQAIEAAAAARNLELDAVYQDVDSGSKTDRPGLQDALAGLQTGDMLIVAKLDRLTRSVVQFASLLERAQLAGWTLVALDMGIDTSTPQGELMVHVLASFAQFERRLISERTKTALSQARANGTHTGRSSTLDSNVGRRIVRLRDQGMTYAAIAELLAAQKVPTGQGGEWRPGTVRWLYQRHSSS